jgi:hypothetical protein
VALRVHRALELPKLADHQVIQRVAERGAEGQHRGLERAECPVIVEVRI